MEQRFGLLATVAYVAFLPPPTHFTTLPQLPVPLLIQYGLLSVRNTRWQQSMTFCRVS